MDIPDNLFFNEPFRVELVEGETYWWCTCGRSMSQPFCDGSHEGTQYAPMAFVASVSGEAWLCGCKQTKRAPYCDGSHENV